MKEKAKALFPGFIVCVIVGILAQILAQFIPTLGSALFSILIGIVAGNTILTSDKFNVGTKFSESRLLEYSIVMTGLTMNIADIARVGFGGVAFIVAQMALTITVAYFIGRAFKFSRKYTLLMCAGNAVCGSSAIATVSDVIKPDAKDKGISITIVNLTGTVLMVTLPILTGVLYNHDTLLTSAMIGGTLQSIGQCIGSATFVNSEVVEFSTIFKIIRIMLIAVVALTFSKVNTEEEGGLFQKKTSTQDVKVKFRIPWYIIGFLICAVITSTSILPAVVGTTAKSVSGQFEIYALAAIGMRVKFKHLLADGPKAVAFGGCVGCCQVILAIGLIALFF